MHSTDAQAPRTDALHARTSGALVGNSTASTARPASNARAPAWPSASTINFSILRRIASCCVDESGSCTCARHGSGGGGRAHNCVHARAAAKSPVPRAPLATRAADSSLLLELASVVLAARCQHRPYLRCKARRHLANARIPACRRIIRRAGTGGYLHVPHRCSRIENGRDGGRGAAPLRRYEHLSANPCWLRGGP